MPKTLLDAESNAYKLWIKLNDKVVSDEAYTEFYQSFPDDSYYSVYAKYGEKYSWLDSEDMDNFFRQFGFDSEIFIQYNKLTDGDIESCVNSYIMSDRDPKQFLDTYFNLPPNFVNYLDEDTAITYIEDEMKNDVYMLAGDKFYFFKSEEAKLASKYNWYNLLD